MALVALPVPTHAVRLSKFAENVEDGERALAQMPASSSRKRSRRLKSQHAQEPEELQSFAEGMEQVPERFRIASEAQFTGENELLNGGLYNQMVAHELAASHKTQASLAWKVSDTVRIQRSPPLPDANMEINHGNDLLNEVKPDPKEDDQGQRNIVGPKVVGHISRALAAIDKMKKHAAQLGALIDDVKGKETQLERYNYQPATPEFEKLLDKYQIYDFWENILNQIIQEHQHDIDFVQHRLDQLGLRLFGVYRKDEIEHFINEYRKELGASSSQA
ncbi:hypothetical protein ACQY0O_003708 [Thecaphora frezii]